MDKPNRPILSTIGLKRTLLDIMPRCFGSKAADLVITMVAGTLGGW